MIKIRKKGVLRVQNSKEEPGSESTQGRVGCGVGSGTFRGLLERERKRVESEKFERK